MGKFIEILAMVLGGVSLFAVCFLGFAVMSGKPLSDVPGLGSLAEPLPVEPVGEEDTQRSPSNASTPKPKHRTQNEVIASVMGVMPAFALPSPYTQAQLKALVDDLKGTQHALALREEAVTAREEEAGERERTLNARFKQLDTMRKRLVDFEEQLDLREQEVVRDEEAANDSDQLTWAETAAVFAELEANTASQRIVEYDAADAAKILRAMDPATATEILKAIPMEKWKEYLTAYSELQPEK